LLGGSDCPNLAPLNVITKRPRVRSICSQARSVPNVEVWTALEAALLLKRPIDVLVAGVALVAFWPALLLIALLIKLDSPGPVLYRQARHGRNERVFTLVKFRTLRVETCAPAAGPFRQVTPDDPRVTRVGRVLRWLSLDELPQLVNVLRGEMSIVGPRPHPVALNEQYATTIDGYLSRHRVKPGITGWAQVNGLRGETNTADKMERRVQYDLHYIEHWSLGFDLRIMARTLRFGFIHSLTE
jgi:exopolysaccharide biosynthesis polyprenyl glycosylphosphotransferase